MAVNRLLGLFREEIAISRDEGVAALTVPAFAPYPLAFIPNSLQQQIYQTAWEHARKATTPRRSRWPDVVEWN